MFESDLNIGVTTRDEDAEGVDREVGQDEPGRHLLWMKRTLQTERSKLGKLTEV